jgi:hypothetical protein
MRIALSFVGVVALSFSIGCTKPADDNSPQAAVQESAVEPVRKLSENGPDAAVHQFLEAVRTGNDEGASQMLTPLARQKTAEYQMVVAPQSSDTASFRVSDVEMIGDDGAHVQSFWTDIDENGEKHTDTIIWMVRKEPQGWRIAGMATRVIEDKPAVIMNFEDPEEMLAKQQQIEEELAGQSAATTGDQSPQESADARNRTESPRPLPR